MLIYNEKELDVSKKMLLFYGLTHIDLFMIIFSDEYESGTEDKYFYVLYR